MAEEQKDASVYSVLRTLIDHSTLGGRDKIALHGDVNKIDPDAEYVEPEAEPETQEEELIRLRTELQKLAPLKTAAKYTPAPAETA
jgi:hypothetical protein